MTCSKDRRSGFTLVELLVVIAIISIIASLVVPTLRIAGDEADKLARTNNLRGIQQVAFLYARKERAFPIAHHPSPRAHESLNMLLESSIGAELEPDVFDCPAGEALAEAPESDSRGYLDALRLDYTWVAKRTRSTKKGFLSSDKYPDGYEDADGTHEGHPGAIMAVTTSGAVKEIDASDPSLEGEMLLPGLTR